MKRRKGLACGSALDSDCYSKQELKGEVYNIFPYIESPKHLNDGNAQAFTLPGFIECIFFPAFHEEELQRIPSYVRHERGHYILLNTMITCEQRAVAAKLLGKVWNFFLPQMTRRNY